jgi:hypothetical protein
MFIWVEGAIQHYDILLCMFANSSFIVYCNMQEINGVMLLFFYGEFYIGLLFIEVDQGCIYVFIWL